MFKHKSHRLLKNRAKKRRIRYHNYPPEYPPLEHNDYQKQRDHRVAITKLKCQPDLLDDVLKNLETKQAEDPQQPQLLTWQALLDSLQKCSNKDELDTDHLEEVVLDSNKQAKLLRQHSALDCLYKN